MIMRYIISLTLLFLISLGAIAQSPWVKEKGSAYTQLSLNMITEYTAIYSSSGDHRQLPRAVTDQAIQFYGEFGIGGDWQISTALPYKLLKTGAISSEYTGGAFSIEEGTHNALGNIELAIKKNFINKSFLLSGQLKTVLPTSSFDETTGLRSGLDALSIIPSLTIGKGWNQSYGYVSVGSAIRTNDYSGDFRISGELGTQPIKKFWIVLVLDVVSSFENATPDIPINQFESGIYLNNQEYFAYGLKFAYELKEGWGINLAGYGGASGNAVARAPSINFGAYYEW
jgi:hypothetical protein